MARFTPSMLAAYFTSFLASFVASFGFPGFSAGRPGIRCLSAPGFAGVSVFPDALGVAFPDASSTLTFCESVFGGASTPFFGFPPASR